MIRLKEVIVDKRVRKEMGDIDTLIASIKEIGLLHPIVLYKDSNTLKHHLLAGRRRLEAYKRMGEDTIPARSIELDDVLKAELHENTVL